MVNCEFVTSLLTILQMFHTDYAKAKLILLSCHRRCLTARWNITNGINPWKRYFACIGLTSVHYEKSKLMKTWQATLNQKNCRNTVQHFLLRHPRSAATSISTLYRFDCGRAINSLCRKNAGSNIVAERKSKPTDHRSSKNFSSLYYVLGARDSCDCVTRATMQCSHAKQKEKETISLCRHARDIADTSRQLLERERVRGRFDVDKRIMPE